MTLGIIRVGGGATLQGPCRHGLRQFGVPPAGPFDWRSAAAANAQLGNSPDAAVLELVLGNFSAKVEVGGWIAIAGAEAPMAIDGSVAAFGPVALAKGQQVDIGFATRGCRLYLAASGGWLGPTTFGAVSGQQVLSGNLLEAPEGEPHPNAHFDTDTDTDFATDLEIVAARPDWAGRSAELEVGLHSNRMGVRLLGFEPCQEPERLSEPLDVGCVQWTPAGELIVIGPDGPTIGGYPRVGFVRRAFWPRVAQWTPRTRVQVRFVADQAPRMANVLSEMS